MHRVELRLDKVGVQQVKSYKASVAFRANTKDK